MTASSAALESRWLRWSFAALAAVLLAATNLPWQLDDYDQAKQAFTSFEMVEQGHWLYQHTPNEWVATKPPLVGWISAGAFCLTRNWEIAWRLPSFLSAIALLILLSRRSHEAFGATAAIVAVCALAFNLFTPRLATLVRTDMPLALVIFALGMQIWGKLRDASEWTFRDRAIAFVLLTAGMLVKGPIVLAFLLPGLLIYYSLGRTNRAWPGWSPLLLAFAVFAAWVVGGVLDVPEFFENVVVREFAGRFEGTHRAQPFYFYVPHLFYRFAPWSVLMIAFTIGGRAGTRRRSYNSLAPETRWLICWIAGGLVMMSLVPSKRPDRIFPLVPPLCLLLATQFASATNRLRASRLALLAIFVAAAVTTGYSASKVTGGYREHRDDCVRFSEDVRRAAAAQRLRFAVVGGADEGILLYLRQTAFTQLTDAVDQFNACEIDGIVAPQTKAPLILSRLPDAQLLSIGGPGAAAACRNRCAFIVRAPRQP